MCPVNPAEELCIRLVEELLASMPVCSVIGDREAQGELGDLESGSERGGESPLVIGVLNAPKTVPNNGLTVFHAPHI